jgi:hypothetical protein
LPQLDARGGGSMSTPEDNIRVILADWLGALRRHDLDAIE